MSPMRIAIAGASGRMGRMLIEATTRDDGARLIAALDRADSPAIGEDACAFLGIRSGVQISSDVDAALAGARAWSFDSPRSTAWRPTRRP